MPAAHRFVTSDGTELHVERSGSQAAPVTLVLVHAWTQDHTEWDPVLAALPEPLSVLRYDHRGHGVSAAASEFTATLETLADDLAELITELVPRGQVVLAGHSMGGMTVMALAERHPELVRQRVAGVAFVATSCEDMDRLQLGLRGPAGDLAARADQAFGRGLTRWGRETIPLRPRVASPFVRWLAFGKRADHRAVRAMSAQVVRAHPMSVGGFRASMTRHRRRQALAVLRAVPSYVLVGTRDRITPAEHARVIAGELPNAEFVLFPDAGHELTYERGNEVTARLADLVRRAPALEQRGPAASGEPAVPTAAS